MQSQTQPDEKFVTLKHEAATYGCASSSLKTNAKNGKLPSMQEDTKAPIMVLPKDVESFLRNTPQIESTFHRKSLSVGSEAFEEPSSISQSAASVVKDGQDPTCGVGDTRATQPASGTIAEPAAEPVAEPVTSTSGPSQTFEDIKTDGPKASVDSVAVGRKRKRRRKRGKGGTVPTAEATGMRQIRLKALDGASAESRLLVNACLCELASLIASPK
ncbi:MAG: hypothetical protein EOP84_01370 [Verrucomicrobiaceae bacterium]|nr:MAG: hypothetical protein EOP84_01370 [Verrucomicrobiaceae bacterium]